MGKLSKFFSSKEKWLQGDFSNKYNIKNGEAETLCYCIIGGYCKLRGIDPFGNDLNDGFVTIMNSKTPPTLVKIYNALPKKFKKESKYKTKQDCIAKFNDDKATTFKKVKNLLAKAGV